MRRSLLLSLVLLLCPVLPAAAQQVLRQEGRAYAPADGRLLYRETHWLQGPPTARSRLVLYRCADGRAFARKWMTPQGSPQTPDFAFEDARNGYQEGLQVTAGTLVYARNRPRLLQFSGTGNVRDAQGRYPQVRVEFPAEPVAASAAELAAARQQPLVATCAG